MELGLKGRVALVTGASKGIGLASAQRLAEEGCAVHLVARTEPDLKEAAEQIGARSDVPVQVWPMDLASRGSAERLFAQVGEVDILVNNAGAIPQGTIERVDEQTWREAWDLKVFGYVNTCRLAFAAMKQRGRGVIINVIGAAGERPSAGYVAGSAGNASLMALTRALGATSSKYGIRVVAINPGAIETPRLVTLLQGAAVRRFGDGERWRELLDPDFPPGQPAHIADMVAFLASDRSSNTTGTVITIDGGHSAR